MGRMYQFVMTAFGFPIADCLIESFGPNADNFHYEREFYLFLAPYLQGYISNI